MRILYKYFIIFFFLRYMEFELVGRDFLIRVEMLGNFQYYGRFFIGFLNFNDLDVKCRFFKIFVNIDDVYEEFYLIVYKVMSVVVCFMIDVFIQLILDFC